MPLGGVLDRELVQAEGDGDVAELVGVGLVQDDAGAGALLPIIRKVSSSDGLAIGAMRSM